MAQKVQHLETEITKNARDFVKLNELTKEKEETEEKLSHCLRVISIQNITLL